jgi:hypothetical protein
MTSLDFPTATVNRRLAGWLVLIAEGFIRREDELIRTPVVRRQTACTLVVTGRRVSFVQGLPTLK